MARPSGHGFRRAPSGLDTSRFSGASGVDGAADPPRGAGTAGSIGRAPHGGTDSGPWCRRASRGPDGVGGATGIAADHTVAPSGPPPPEATGGAGGRGPGSFPRFRRPGRGALAERGRRGSRPGGSVFAEIGGRAGRGAEPRRRRRAPSLRHGRATLRGDGPAPRPRHGRPGGAISLRRGSWAGRDRPGGLPSDPPVRRTAGPRAVLRDPPSGPPHRSRHGASLPVSPGSGASPPRGIGRPETPPAVVAALRPGTIPVRPCRAATVLPDAARRRLVPAGPIATSGEGEGGRDLPGSGCGNGTYGATRPVSLRPRLAGLRGRNPRHAGRAGPCGAGPAPGMTGRRGRGRDRWAPGRRNEPGSAVRWRRRGTRADGTRPDGCDGGGGRGSASARPPGPRREAGRAPARAGRTRPARARRVAPARPETPRPGHPGCPSRAPSKATAGRRPRIERGGAPRAPESRTATASGSGSRLPSPSPSHPGVPRPSRSLRRSRASLRSSDTPLTAPRGPRLPRREPRPPHGRDGTPAARRPRPMRPPFPQGAIAPRRRVPRGHRRPRAARAAFRSRASDPYRPGRDRAAGLRARSRCRRAPDPGSETRAPVRRGAARGPRTERRSSRAVGCPGTRPTSSVPARPVAGTAPSPRPRPASPADPRPARAPRTPHRDRT